MPDDVCVGVIANSASGRDIRRLVAGASVFGNADKAGMVFRLLAGLGAAGVARKAEATALNQYRAGTVDYTTVVTTQQTALSNELTLLNIRLARYTASSNLVAAVGGGWRDSDMPPPVPIIGSETSKELKKKSWWPF